MMTSAPSGVLKAPPTLGSMTTLVVIGPRLALSPTSATDVSNGSGTGGVTGSTGAVGPPTTAASAAVATTTGSAGGAGAAGGKAPTSESGSTTLATRPPAGPLGALMALPLVLGLLLEEPDGALLLVFPAGILDAAGLGVLVATTVGIGAVGIGAVGITLLDGADATLLPITFTAV